MKNSLAKKKVDKLLIPSNDLHFFNTEFALEKRNWPDVIWLSLCFVAAISFRLFLLNFQYAIGWDEPHYLQLGASFAQGSLKDVLHPFWPPMYPILIGVFSWLISDYELAGRLVSILTGSLIVLPIFILAKHVFDRKIALGAIALVAIYPPFAFGSTTALTESTYTFFLLSGISLGWFALKRGSLVLGGLTGLAFALAYLTRPEGVGGLIVFCLFGVFFSLFSYFSYGRVKSCLVLSFAIFAFFIFSLPYLIYLKDETGTWTLSAKASALQQGESTQHSSVSAEVFTNLSSDNTELLDDQIYHIGDFARKQREKGKFYVAITPAIVLRKFATNFYHLIKNALPALFTVFIFVLFSLGLFGRPWPKAKAILILYLLSFLAFYWAILVPLFHINERYLMSLLPMAFIWIGNGFAQLSQWFEASFNRLRELKRFQTLNPRIFGLGFVTMLFLLFSFLPELGKILNRKELDSNYWGDAVELKRAGLWLKENVDHPPALMSYNKAVDFYAGNYNIRTGASLSNDDFDRVLAYARHRHAEYVVLDQRYAARFPKLNFLLQETGFPEDLKLVYENAELPGAMVRIFRLMDRVTGSRE